MGYLTFRGVSTQSLQNVYVQKMPDHRKARKRMTEYYVNGRDGALHVDNGFENTLITVRLVLINAGAEARQIVNAWADGRGKLISSDDLSRAWMATVIDEIIWKRTEGAAVNPEVFSTSKAYYVGDYCTYAGMVYKFKTNHAAGAWNSAHVTAQPWKINGLYDTAEITFDCEPCMIESVDSTIEFTADGTITNAGTAEAFPLIKVEGSGNVTFTIAGEEITIDSMSANTPVFIDCATGYIYTADGQAKEMHGNIPYLPLGISSVDLGTNATKITITPHWRWV